MVEMKPYRKEKMTSLVQRIVSEAIGQKLADPRIAPLTTVSRVKMTGDLTIATVYLTIPGDEAAERTTLRAIQHASGFLQHTLAQELQARQCPELRFEVDESAKRAKETLRLLAENRREHPEWSEEAAKDPVRQDEPAPRDFDAEDAVRGEDE
jgi:ribosome-binding factor A